jgi:hypothetical protein
MPVGLLKPNEFGLFGLHGLGWCWGQDVFVQARKIESREPRWSAFGGSGSIWACIPAKTDIPGADADNRPARKNSGGALARGAQLKSSSMTGSLN